MRASTTFRSPSASVSFASASALAAFSSRAATSSFASAAITCSALRCSAAIFSWIDFVSAATRALFCLASAFWRSSSAFDFACTICCSILSPSCTASSRWRMMAATSCGAKMSRISTELSDTPQGLHTSFRYFSSESWNAWRDSPTMNSVAFFFEPSMREKPRAAGRTIFCRMSSMSPTSCERSATLSTSRLNSSVPSAFTVKPSSVRKEIASAPLNSKRWLWMLTIETA